MEVAAEKITKMIQNQWPMMSLVLLTDPVYILPELGEALDFAKSFAGDEAGFIKHIWACEEFSLDFMIALRKQRRDRYHAGEEVPKYNRAVGLIFDREARVGLHYQNIIVSKDKGVVVFEPQADKIVSITEAYYVFM